MEAIEYFKDNKLASDVWKSKYALKNEKGERVEDHPGDMHIRMAKEFARISQSYGWNNELEGLSNYGKQRNALDTKDIYNLFMGFRKIIPQGSIMAGLGNPYYITSLSNCLGGDTKVLTQNGLQKISDLSGSTHSILTKGGHWVEAPFKSYGQQRLWKIKLSRGKSNTKTIYATGDHRWYVQKYGKVYEEKITKDLSNDDKLKLTFGKNRGSLTPSQFGISHGIVYGDGHTVNGIKNSNNITLCADSRDLGKYMIVNPISSNEDLCEDGSDFYSGIPNYFRELPSLNENHQYLYGWLAGYFAADGHIDSGGTAFIDSANKKDIEFVQDICAILGIGCGDIKKSNVISNLTNKPHTMYRLTLFTQHLSKEFFLLDKHLNRYNEKRKNVFRWKVDSVEKTDKIEEVYCAEVPETESFVIEGNILTGNCVVLKDVVDSYGGILYTDQQLAQLMKRRCGVGVDISNLRPRGTATKNAAKTSTGAVSFLKRFSDTTNEVAQEGRRGALMVTLDCRHPDILEFIESKGDSTSITGANISVKWHDEFMEAAKNDEEYTLRYPVGATVEEAQVTKTVNARDLVVRSAQMAHGANKDGENETGFGGDPGCMFIDRMINYSTDCGYPNVTVLSTNPCGEIGMHNDCCRLIALNLFSCVRKPFTKEAHIDVRKLEELAYEQQVLLDNLVDLEIEKIDRILDKIDSDDEPEFLKATERKTWEELKESAVNYRRTGGGFTALGDTLASLGYEYGSEESLQMVEHIMKAKFRGECNASIDLSIQRGSFPKWDSTYDSTEFFEMMEDEFPDILERNNTYGRRNISLSTVAPTGSVSMLANIGGHFGTTSGIEPVFSTEPNVLWHTRRKKAQEGDTVTETDENGIDWTEYKVFHEGFRQWLETSLLTDNYEWFSESKDFKQDYTKEQLVHLAKQSPYVTSAELDYKQRIDLQAVVQKYTTHSISSTLNLPTDANWQQTLDIYNYAYDAGLKGVTIFRNGSKRGVLEGDKKQITSINYDDAPKRPEVLDANVHVVRDQWTVVVGMLDGKPYELFVMNEPEGVHYEYVEIRKSKSRKYDLFFHSGDDVIQIEDILQYSPSSDADVLTRFVSMLMRHGVKMEFIVEQVEKADIGVTDFSAVVNSVLKQYVNEVKGLTCDNCGSEGVAYVEGCATCQECGSSKCG